MIGYKNKKYKYFGWASARVDDLVNIIPARITGVLYAIVSNNFLFTISIMLKDGHKHISPNAGYPESAMAGALNIKLSGPRFYNNIKRNDPWLNEKGLDPSVKNLKKALMLYKRIIILIITIILLLLILKLDVL
jgi:adenosylcobinamide-phosphate synthase